MENTPLDEVKLTDVIELDFLQEFQDAFANSVGMAALTIDSYGPVTKPSNFTDFCLKYTRGSCLGLKRCQDCDMKSGKAAAKKGEPIVYSCHSGLYDFAVPIIVNGKHLGSIFGGQVLIKEPDESEFRKLAKEFGIDENEYIDALRQVKVLNLEKVEAAAKLLFIAANSISKIAHKNYELLEKSKKEDIYRKISDTIRNSLDINIIKKNIVSEVGKALSTYRCFVTTIAEGQNRSIPLDNNSIYLSSKDVKNMVGANITQNTTDYFKSILTNLREMLYIYPDEYIKENKLEGSDVEAYFKEYNIKTAIFIPIVYSDELLGILSIHYDYKRKIYSDDTIEFIKNIADQIGLALHQNILYEKEIKTAQRETLLRKITEAISDNINIDKVLKLICTEVAKLFNIQRAVIVEYRNPDNYGDYIIRNEFKSTPDIKSITDIESFERAAAYWGENVFLSNNLLVFDNISESNTPEYFKTAYKATGAKSAIGAAIQKDKNNWGVILLFEYDYYRHWTQEEQNLLTTIANQIYISIKQVELYSEIIQQAQREKSILNNLPFMAWLKDKECKFLTVNSAFAKHVNLEPEAIIDKKDIDIFPEELALKHYNDDLTTMRSQQKIHFEEIIPNDNEKRWYETYKAPVLNQNGEVIGTTGFSIDVTERKRIEQMKNEFVSIISHELRTPLTSIRGALGLVTSGALGALPDKVSTLLNIASNNSIRLVNLINDILDLEKIKAGKMEFKFQEHEIMPLIEETIQYNEEYAKQYNIKFEIKSHIDNALINVDKDKFIQVLTNLVSNAAKFSYPNEVVEITVERKKNLILTSVTNKGHGIPESAYSKIFESFSQVDSSDTRAKGGTGLGLNISKSITEKMGGNINFTSVLDDKTTFYFEFPEIIKHNENKKVLICEDNKTTAFCIKSMFQKLNYDSDIALTASEAEELLKNNNYYLMTLDIILPDKSGLTLLDEIQANEKTKDMPIIIISVSKKDLELMESKHGIVDWLEKSFDSVDLENSVKKIMEKKNKNKVEILHIENDKDLLNLIDITLNDIANVTKVSTLAKANEIIQQTVFDIIILDYVFPDGTSDKLLPVIKSGINKDAKLVMFSAYEENKIISRYIDEIILKTNVSSAEFKNCIEKVINNSK